MSTVIGAMEAYLKLNIDDFEKNLKEAKKQVESISTGFDMLTAVGTKISKVGKGLTVGLTTPIVGIGTACVKTTADFDSAMSKVSAISGTTGNDLSKLRDKAKEMGEKTKFSATESAEAFTYMAMAGWDSGQMIEGISGIMNLAAADGLDLATTSDIVTDALTAFGLQAKDSGHFADVLAKASSSANTNVSMLGESFKYAAPVAGSLGYSAEDTAVALGLMANAGIKGSQAGTTLRAALTRMIKPTDDAAAMMDKYGISMTNSDGSMKSLGEVMGTLRDKLGGLTEAEQSQVAATLFGQEAMSGMLSIINASEGDYNKLTEAIANADGTAEQMANTMNDNLQGQLTLLKSQLEGVAIQIGEKLIPHIRNFLTRVSEWVSKFSELFEAHGDLILKIAGIVAAIGPMLFAVGKAISLYGKMGTAITNVKAICTAAGGAMEAFGASLSAVLAPVIAVVAIIGTLVAAFMHLWNTNEEFRTAMTEIWNGIVSKIQEFCQGIVDRLNALGFDFQSITEVLGAIWDGFCNLLAPVFEGAFAVVSSILGTVLDMLTGLLDVFIGIFTGNWGQAWQGVKEIFSGVWEGIKGIFSAVLGTLQGIANTVLGWFGTNWETVWTNIKSFFEGIWNGISVFFSGILTSIKTTATNIWNGITTAISTALNAIKTAISTVFNAIKTIVTTVTNGIKAVISTVWNAIKTTVTTVINAIKSVVSNVWNGIKSATKTAWNAVKSSVSTAMNGAKSAATTAVNGIKSGISSAWNSAKSATSSAFNSIKSSIGNTLQSAVSIAKSKCQSILSGMKNVFSGVSSTFSSIGKNVIQGIINGIGSMVGALYNSIKNALSGLVDKAKRALGINSPSRVFRDRIGRYIPEGIAVGIDANTSEAEGSVVSMTKDMLERANNFRQRFVDLMNVGVTPDYNLALAGIGGGNIRVGSGMTGNDYSALNKAGQQVVEKTEIHIGKIEVRDDHDLDMVTQGLYNKQDQNLRALGRRNV